MKRLLNFRLALFVAISLALGILCVYCLCCDLALLSAILLAVFLGCLAVYAFIFTKRENRCKSLMFCIVFILVFSLGGARFYLSVSQYENADLGNHYYSITARVKEVNDTDYGVKYILDQVDVKGDVSGRLLYNVELFVYDKTDYELGDYLSFEGHLVDKSLFYDGRFSSYSLEGGVKYSVTATAEGITLLKSSPSIFQKTNLLIKNNLKSGLSEDAFAVAYALLTGNSDYIDVDTLTSYRQAGVAHIFAVSGLHIGFLAGVVDFILKKFKCPRLIKAVITTCLLFFYSGVCGFTASSLRATVMCAVMSFITASGEKYDGITGWSIAGLIILLVSPTQLLCAGFQLSFIVVFGLLILAKPLERLLKFLPKKLASSLGTVLSAQIVGAPACLMLFGETSFIAIILNLILIPIVSVIFTLTLIVTLLTAIFGGHGVLFFPLEYCYRGVNYAITFFDYDVFMIGGIVLGGTAVFYYLAVIVASGFVNLKTKVRTTLSLSLCAVFFLSALLYNIEVNNRSYVIISGTESVCFTVIDTPESTVGVVSQTSGYFSTSRLKRIAVNNDIEKLDVLIIAEGERNNIMSIVGSIRGVFDLGLIVYHGEADDVFDQVFLKSFPEYYIDNFYDGENVIDGQNLKVSYTANGMVVNATVNGKKVGLFSEIDTEKFQYSDLDKDYYLSVFAVDGYVICNAIKPQMSLTFRADSPLPNAQTGGNVSLLIR